MSNEDEGGPAFPVPSYVNADVETFESKPQGMSLRDWFAGQAIAGMNASMVNSVSWPDSTGCTLMAESAYRQADAMLKVRGYEPHS